MVTLEQLLDEILENDPSPETVHRILARRRADERPEKTIQMCRKALRVHPNHMGLRSLLADAYLDSGLAARAVEELERITSDVDSTVSAYRRLAEVYTRQSRTPDAVRCLKIYLAHHPEDEDAREQMDRLLPEEAPAPEEMDLAEMVEGLGPQVSDELPEIATPTLAELYVNQGQLETAIQTYRKVLEQYPEDDRSRSRLEELESMQRASEAGAAPVMEEPAMPSPAEPVGLEEETPVQPEAAPLSPERRKSERMISVLESWLNRLHEPKSELSS
jgi:predicted Zn-dependent protease